MRFRLANMFHCAADGDPHVLNGSRKLLIEQIQRRPARNVTPDSLGEAVAGKEDDSIDRILLVVAHQRHLAAVLKA